MLKKTIMHFYAGPSNGSLKTTEEGPHPGKRAFKTTEDGASFTCKELLKRLFTRLFLIISSLILHTNSSLLLVSQRTSSKLASDCSPFFFVSH